MGDGSAHKKFDAEFTDSAGVDDYIPPKRSAATFLGQMGCPEIDSKWRAAIPSLQTDCGLAGDEWDEIFGISK